MPKVTLRFAVASLTIAAAAGALVSVNCGIITAPISIPSAIMQNGQIAARGTISDEADMPLDGVTMKVVTDVSRWDPMWARDSDSHEKTLRVEGRFEAREWCESFDITFDKEGFAQRKITVDGAWLTDHMSGEPATATCWPSNEVRYPANTPVRIVLEKKDRILPALHYLEVAFDCEDPDTFPALDLTQTLAANDHPRLPNNQQTRELEARLREGFAKALHRLDAHQPPKPMPPHSLWLAIVDQPPKIIGPHNEIDPQSIALPASVTFHISDADGGFIPFTPVPGQDPFSAMSEAPASGYSAAVVLDPAQLRGLYAQNNEFNNYFSFYFRSDGHYGKALVMSGERFSNKYLPLKIAILTQPDGTRNLASRGFPLSQ